MKTLTFHNNDTMPMLGLGTWKSEPGQVYEAVLHALRVGYRHIDCAAIYGNEKEVGAALSEALSKGILSRDELWVTSKLWNDSHEIVQVQPALERSLAALQLEYLDLYLIHWPVALKKGVDFPQSAEDFHSLEDVPLVETWGGMEMLVDKGLCKHIGVSNFSVSKLQQIQHVASRQPEMNQIELHPYLAQRKMLEFCHEQNVFLTAYSPLGSPDRPAKLQAEGDPILLEEPLLQEIAEEVDASVAQVLIAWALHRDTAVIPKSVTPSRIEENLAAAELSLSDTQVEKINSLDRERRYIDGSFWSAEEKGYTLERLWA